ncbi:hypothetical protein [Chitinophaga defluvii]|uniref:Uncharacterized protein n=1 Tax=Chitinophaga defluvii TaxID=3163343 RepID=A0ABV2T8M3_9BACT
MTKLIRKIVNEQVELLQQQGFDEHTLRSPYRDGWLKDELMIHVTKAFKDMHYDNSPTDFVIHAVGRVDSNKGVANYDLHFHFDSKKKNLFVTKVESRMGVEKVAVLVGENGYLPHSKDLLQLLSFQATSQRTPTPRQVLPPRKPRMGL